MVAGEDVAKLRGPVAQRDLLGHADLLQLLLLEGAHILRAAAGWVWNSRSISADETKLDGGKTLVEFSRGKEALEQIVGSGSPVW